MADTPTNASALALTAQIVSAHVAHNPVAAEALPPLIQQVYAALANAGTSTAPVEKPQPAVPVKRSVFPDHIICLEDGAKMTMLKRYLHTRYSMTPDQYRERWGLPADYPMVAPRYAQRRSALAKQIGLGRKPKAEPAPKPARRSRKPRTEATVD